MVEISLKGYNEIQTAIRNYPSQSKTAVQVFFQRGLAEIDRTVKTSPWQVGQSGGGVPVASGNLRQRGHVKELGEWKATYGIDPSAVRYAAFVHEGTRYMRPRPWLDYAKEASMPEIERLQESLIDSLVSLLQK